MNTLDYILTKYNLSSSTPSPIEIRNTNRETLTVIIAELGFKEGAEVGTERGLYADMICRNNPGVKLHCVDPWEAYKGYRDHVSQDKLDGFYDHAKALLEPHGCVLHRGYSLDVVNEFKDNSLDFAYIDANHELSYVLRDIVEWHKKVKPGGIVAGHDYRRFKKQCLSHVVEAMFAYTEAYRISPWFVLGSKDKQEGELRDGARSWFYVKT